MPTPFEDLEATVKAIRAQIEAAEYARLYRVNQIVQEASHLRVVAPNYGTMTPQMAAIAEAKTAAIKAEAIEAGTLQRDNEIRDAVARMRDLRVALVQQCVAASNDVARLALAIEQGKS